MRFLQVRVVTLLGRLSRFWALTSCMSNSRHYERHWKVPFVLYLSLTQSIVSLIRVTFMLPPSAAEVLEYHCHVAENDQRWWENRSFVECHDELVPLKLPHLVWYRFDFEKCVARRQEEENNIRLKMVFGALPKMIWQYNNDIHFNNTGKCFLVTRRGSRTKEEVFAWTKNGDNQPFWSTLWL